MTWLASFGSLVRWLVVSSVVFNTLLRAAVLLHLLAQGVAIDAQHFRRAGLVAANVFQHHFEQRLFDAVNYHVVHLATGRFAVEVFEIFLERFAHVARHFILADQPIAHAASSSM